MDTWDCFRTGMAMASVAVVLCAAGARAAGGTLVVKAGQRATGHVPMSVALPAGVTGASFAGADATAPHQVSEGRLWWVQTPLAAGATRTYEVTLGKAAPPREQAVRMTQRDQVIDVTIGGKPFTSYVFAPKASGPHVLRRPMFFPVYGPGQTTMTRPFPMVLKGLGKNVATDHPHHTSIYIAHGSVNGVDNWSIGPTAGYTLHKRFACVSGGAVMGLFRESLDWTDVSKKPVVHEMRVVRVFAPEPGVRMLDIEITFEAKYGAVRFGDTKEGGLCAVRMRTELRADGKGSKGVLVNSEGHSGKAAWGKKARWIDCSGLVDGKRVGFAIFDSPGNLRHPTTWHARTYGLVTANPFGLSHFTRGKQRGDYTLDEGKQRTWRYRIVFHAGDAKAARIASRFADYAAPPTASWK